jgi:hypothetical protein
VLPPEPGRAGRHNGGVRFLAGLGALLFAYLALIPGGLIFSVWDDACSGGECESSLFSRIAFTLLYGACLAAVLGTAAAFAHHALRGTFETQERLARAMMISAFVVGGATFVLFCVAVPLGGAIAGAIAAGGYLLLRLRQRREDTPAGGVERVNGHRPLG